MSQEYVKYPCCEKMVPANDVELNYCEQDAIASMSEDEIELQCKYTNDNYGRGCLKLIWFNQG